MQRHRDKTRAHAPQPESQGSPASPPDAAALGTPAAGSRGRLWKVALIVAALTTLALWPSLSNDFVNWDDHEYVLENPRIREWTAANLRAIWTESRAANYHPLVIMTHLVEHSCWGLDPQGYHAVNLALHVATTLLVLAFVHALGLGLCAAGLTAALFGVHPVHVESVAWIAERKDVLCATWYMLALWLYVRGLKRRPGRFPWAAFSVYILALLSKPMAVTWPFVAALVDRYLDRRITARWWIEKALFLLPCAGLALATLAVQADKHGIRQGETWNVWRNLQLASRAYVFGLEKLLVPVHLSAFYPRHGWAHPALMFMLLTILVLGAFVVLFRSQRRWPPAGLVFLGLGWYAVSFLPVSGIVPIGFVLTADRYMYLPSVGPLFVAAAGLCAMGDRSSRHRLVLGGLIAVWLAMFMSLTWIRCAVWRDGESLWQETVRLAPNHYTYRMLGMAQMSKGQLAEAEQSLHRSFEDSETQFGRYYLAEILKRQGRHKEALAWYEKFLATQDWYVPALTGQGLVLMELGRAEEAAVPFAQCINREPDEPSHKMRLGWALMQVGRLDDAEVLYQMGLEQSPDDPELNYNYGVLLMWDKRYGQAEARYRRTLAARPDHQFALVNLGLTLRETRRPDEARAVLTHALALYPNDRVAAEELRRLEQVPADPRPESFAPR